MPWGIRAAWAVLLIGLLTSGVAALYHLSNLHHANRAEFQVTANDVSATLATGLKRDVDVVATLRAIASFEPYLTTPAFQQWHDEIGRNEQHVGQFGTAIIKLVPANRLSSFARRFEADPALHALTGGSFRVVPAGARPRYCLISAWLSPLTRTAGQLPFPINLDFCAASTSVSAPLSVWPTLEAEVDTGSVTALAGLPGVSSSSALVLTAAFYRAGAPTATSAQRRAALEGWVGTGFDLAGQVRAALGRQHHGLIVDVYERGADGSRRLVAAAASGSRGMTHTRAVDASSRWDIVVRGDEPNGATTGLRALAVFLIGAMLSGLAFLLFRRIGRARDHAVTLLNERDGELLHRALHDPVTGLANRALALESAESRLARARRRATPLAAALIDLDGFKRINAAYTPRVGDELLRAVADRIIATVPETYLVARLGGDEFIVLTDPSGSGPAPESIAERLLAVIRTPFDFPGYMRESVTIIASIGVAFCEAGSVQDLQRDAASALEEAKAAGKDRVVTFDSRVREAAEDRLELEQELQVALREKQFVLVYEPGVDLRSGVVRGVETELRWNHPTRGRLGPAAFMALAEDAGMAADLDRWVIDEACRQGAAWERDGIRLVVAVNISWRQLERRRLVDDLERALTVSGLTPSRLAVDIPERALVSAPAAAGALLEAIKALGVSIAVDEFGTGYATPRQLRRLPVDAVKIDRSFAAAARTSPGTGALIGSLVELAESLGALPIANGVDDPEALESICRAGCPFGQGTLIAPPLDAGAIDDFLAGWPESSPAFQQHHASAAHGGADDGDADTDPDAKLEVILVDDHLAVRKGIELLLRSEGFRIAGLAGQVSEARDLLTRRRHDVALISVHLGTESALPLVEELLRDDPDAAIVLYTGAASVPRIKEAVDVGTRGFVLKSSGPARLVDALRSVADGGAYVDPDLGLLLAEDTEPSKVASLSPRELEIFTLLAEGLTGQAIAERLYLSPETVKTHIRNATAKLQAKTRVQAVALVVREAHVS